MAPLEEPDALHAQAKARLERHEVSEARVAAMGALEKFRAADDLQGQIAVLPTLVQAHVGTKNFNEAMWLAEDMLTQFQRAGDKKGEAVALAAKASVHIAEKEPLHAKKVAGEAQVLAQELGDAEAEVAALRPLIKASIALTPHEALQLATDALPAFEKVEGAAGRAAALLLCAEARLATGEPAEYAAAVTAAREAVAALQKAGSKAQQAAALQMQASASVAAGALEDGRRAATGAVLLYREARDKIGQAMASCLIANIDITKQDFDQAARRAQEGADTFRKAGDISKYGEALLTVANAYISRVNYRMNNASMKSLYEWTEAAMGAATLADATFAQVGEIPGQAAAKHQIATVHFVKDQHGEAYYNAEQSLKLWTEASDGRGVATATLLLAQVELKWQKVLEAGEHLQTAERLFKESGDAEGERSSSELFESIRMYYEGSVHQKKRAMQTRDQADEELMSRRGHGWKQGVNLGWGHQYFRFMNMRGRPAANMRQ